MPEYLIIDPQNKEVEFLRLVNGDYVRRSPDNDGLYRPHSAPGLAIVPGHLWPEGDRFSLQGENNPFTVETLQPLEKRTPPIDSGLGWSELPFEPRVDLLPVTLRFEEYICWSPEAKFEFWHGRIQICSREGVRNLTGMLLATLGMVEVCKLTGAIEWIGGLRRRLDLESREEEIRREWREKAARAADEVRSKYSVSRIAITGDLLSDQPLNYWSRLELVVWDTHRNDSLRLYEDLSRQEIDLVEGNWPFFEELLSKNLVTVEEI